MLASEVWHWWIGIVLLIVAVVVGVVLIGGYVKSVSSQRYPGGKRRRQSDI